jgi:UDP-N-acetylglucosamine 2-epimerase (non-hydrolysing)
MLRIVSVVGARPNFMKVAPIKRELCKHGRPEHLIVHTGQHYDKIMSDIFFEQLGLSEPDFHLGVGSGGHGEMTGKIMIEFEKVCLEIKPDLVIVVGDVNSTIAASLVARKLFIPVAHVEAGLRSFDETMPEEHNRRLTDHLSNLLFVSEPSGMENLQREGIDMSRALLVGDIMLETLNMFMPEVETQKTWEDFGLEMGNYALITLHRPSNVDTVHGLTELLRIFREIPRPMLFPMHPRTVNRIKEFNLTEEFESIDNLKIVPPAPYIQFLSLMMGSKLLLSDSGSVQAEAAAFDVPCLICRENTERPIYLEKGTSTLIGRDFEKAIECLNKIEQGSYKRSQPHVKNLGKDVASKTVSRILHYLGS